MRFRLREFWHIILLSEIHLVCNRLSLNFFSWFLLLFFFFSFFVSSFFFFFFNLSSIRACNQVSCTLWWDSFYDTEDEIQRFDQFML